MVLRNKAEKSAAFTIIELLVVISIMAVIATLVTGAAIKAVRQGRNRRVDAMARVLENGLVAYRTSENEWPFDPEKLEVAAEKDDSLRATRYWARAENNYKVFEKLLRKMVTDNVLYFDPSTLLVKGRKPLKDALKEGRYDLPLGYPDPDDSNVFKYFSVEYNQITDSVKVHRE